MEEPKEDKTAKEDKTEDDYDLGFRLDDLIQCKDGKQFTRRHFHVYDKSNMRWFCRLCKPLESLNYVPSEIMDLALSEYDLGGSSVLMTLCALLDRLKCDLANNRRECDLIMLQCSSLGSSANFLPSVLCGVIRQYLDLTPLIRHALEGFHQTSSLKKPPLLLESIEVRDCIPEDEICSVNYFRREMHAGIKQWVGL